MPTKPNNDSNTTLASNGSTDQVVVMQGMLTSLLLNVCPMLILLSGPNGGRKAPVVIHQGGQTYDETRPSDWDKQRWK